jgi:hypothetical protein
LLSDDKGERYHHKRKASLGAIKEVVSIRAIEFEVNAYADAKRNLLL